MRRAIRRRHVGVLLPRMAQQIVATREALKVTAPTEGAVEGVLGGLLLDVLLLVPGKILWVQEALITKSTLMWSLRTIEMCLLMTTSRAQHVSINDQLHRHLSRARASSRTLVVNIRLRVAVWTDRLCCAGVKSIRLTSAHKRDQKFWHSPHVRKGSHEHVALVACAVSSLA
jgi:hypothetical protein